MSRRGRKLKQSAPVEEARELDEIELASIDDCNSLKAVAGSNSSVETVPMKKSSSSDSDEEVEIPKKMAKIERPKRNKMSKPESKENTSDVKKKVSSKKKASVKTILDADMSDNVVASPGDINEDHDGNSKAAKLSAPLKTGLLKRGKASTAKAEVLAKPKGRHQKKDISVLDEEDNVETPATKRAQKKVDKNSAKNKTVEAKKKDQPKTSHKGIVSDELEEDEENGKDSKSNIVKRGKKTADAKDDHVEAPAVIKEYRAKPIGQKRRKAVTLKEGMVNFLDSVDTVTKSIPKERKRAATVVNVNDMTSKETNNIFEGDNLSVPKKQKQTIVKDINKEKTTSSDDKLITESAKTTLPKGRKRAAVTAVSGDEMINQENNEVTVNEPVLNVASKGRKRAAVKETMSGNEVTNGLINNTAAKGHSKTAVKENYDKKENSTTNDMVAIEPDKNVASKGRKKATVKEIIGEHNVKEENTPPNNEEGAELIKHVASKGRKKAAVKKTANKDIIKKEITSPNVEVTEELVPNDAPKERIRAAAKDIISEDNIKKENSSPNDEIITEPVLNIEPKGRIKSALKENEKNNDITSVEPVKVNISKGCKSVAVKDLIQSENFAEEEESSNAVDIDVGKRPKLNATKTLYGGVDFSIKDDFKIKISSWNVAGIRAWITKGGLQYIDYEKPDILCLQETKCVVDQLPDSARIPGYHPYWLCNPGGHAGVAIYSKVMPITVEYGIKDEEQDEKGRIITAEYEKFYLICVYVPNAGRKLVTLPSRLRWDAIFQDYVTKLDKNKPVIICGDMNVAHEEIDLANPKSNKKNAGFTQEERDGMTKLLSLGFVDTFRALYPDKEKCYSFWSYMGNARSKNVGWRLDYFILSERISGKVVENTMRTNVLGSDHCPITLFLNIC